MADSCNPPPAIIDSYSGRYVSVIEYQLLTIALERFKEFDQPEIDQNRREGQVFHPFEGAWRERKTLGPRALLFLTFALPDGEVARFTRHFTRERAPASGW